MKKNIKKLISTCTALRVMSSRLPTGVGTI